MIDLQELRSKYGSDSEIISLELENKYPDLNFDAALTQFSLDEIISDINKNQGDPLNTPPMPIQPIEPVDNNVDELSALKTQYPDLNFDAAIAGGFSIEDIKADIAKNQAPVTDIDSMKAQYPDLNIDAAIAGGFTLEDIQADIAKQESGVNDLSTPFIDRKTSGQTGVPTVDSFDFRELSGKRESSTSGVSTISSGVDDPGGVSYGRHQLASKVGSVDAWLNSEFGSKYKAQFTGTKPGSSAFSEIYRRIAESEPEELESSQQLFIDNKMFTPLLNAAETRGFDITNQGIKSALYSMAVQHGGAKTIVEDVDPSGSPEEVIQRLYDRRKLYVNRLSDMPESTRQALINRYDEEVVEAKQIASDNPQVTDGSNRQFIGEDLGPQATASYNELSRERARRIVESSNPIALAWNGLRAGASGTASGIVRGLQNRASFGTSMLREAGGEPLSPSEFLNNPQLPALKRYYGVNTYEEYLGARAKGDKAIAEDNAKFNERIGKVADWIEGLTPEEIQNKVNMAAGGDQGPFKEGSLKTWIATIAPNIPRLVSTGVGAAINPGLPVLLTNLEMKGEFLSTAEQASKDLGVEFDEDAVIQAAEQYAMPAGAMEYIDNIIDLALLRSPLAGATASIKKKAMSFVGKLGLNGLIEGGTEWTQEGLKYYRLGTMAVESGITDEEYEKLMEYATPDKKRAFIAGMGSGMFLFGAGKAVTSTAQRFRQGQTTAEENAVADELAASLPTDLEAEAGIQMSPEDQMFDDISESMRESTEDNTFEVNIGEDAVVDIQQQENVPENISEEISPIVAEEVYGDAIETLSVEEIQEEIEANQDAIDRLQSRADKKGGAEAAVIAATIEQLDTENAELQTRLEEAEVYTDEAIKRDDDGNEIVDLVTRQEDIENQTELMKRHQEIMTEEEGRQVSEIEAAEDWSSKPVREQKSLAKEYREHTIVAEKAIETNIAEEEKTDIEPNVLRDNTRVNVTDNGDGTITKTFKDSPNGRVSAQERAQTEFDIAKMLNGIAPKTEVVGTDGITMDKIDGVEIGTETLTEQDVVDMAETLSDIHDAGVAHGDFHIGIEDGVKTRDGNIFRDTNGDIRVIDFEMATTREQGAEDFKLDIEEEVDAFVDEQLTTEMQSVFREAYQAKQDSKVEGSSPREEKKTKQRKASLTIPLKENKQKKRRVTPTPNQIRSNSNKGQTGVSAEEKYTVEKANGLSDTQLAAQIKLAAKDNRTADSKLLKSVKARRTRLNAAGIRTDNIGAPQGETGKTRNITPAKAHVEARTEAREAAKKGISTVATKFTSEIDEFVDDNNRYVELANKGTLTDSEKVELRILKRDLLIDESKQLQNITAEIAANKERRAELSAQPKNQLTAEEKAELDSYSEAIKDQTALFKTVPPRLRGARTNITDRVGENQFDNMDANDFRFWLVDKLAVPATLVRDIPAGSIEEIRDSIARYSGMQGLKFRDTVLKKLSTTLSRELTGESFEYAESTIESRSTSLEQSGLENVLTDQGEFSKQDGFRPEDESDYDSFYDGVQNEFDSMFGAEDATTDQQENDRTAMREAAKKYASRETEMVQGATLNNQSFTEVLDVIAFAPYSEADTNKRMRTNAIRLKQLIEENAEIPISSVRTVLFSFQNGFDLDQNADYLRKRSKALYRAESYIERLFGQRKLGTADVLADLESEYTSGNLSQHGYDQALAVIEALGVAPSVSLWIDGQNQFNFAENTITLNRASSFGHETLHWGWYNILSAKDRHDYRMKHYKNYYGKDGTANVEKMKRNIQADISHKGEGGWADNIGMSKNSTYNASEFFAQSGNEALMQGDYRHSDSLLTKVRQFFEYLWNRLKGRTYTDPFLRDYLNVISEAGPTLTAWQAEMRKSRGLNAADIYKQDVGIPYLNLDAAAFKQDGNEFQPFSIYDEEVTAEDGELNSEEIAENISEEISEEVTEEDTKPKREKKQGPVSRKFQEALHGAMLARDLEKASNGELSVQEAQAVFIDYAVNFLERGDLRKSLFRTVKNISTVGDANWNNALRVVGNIIEARNKSEEIAKIKNAYRTLGKRTLAADSKRIYDNAVKGISLKKLAKITELKAKDTVTFLMESLKKGDTLSPLAERRLSEAQERLEATPISDMEVDQLREMRENLELALSTDRQIKKQIAARGKARREYAQERAVEAAEQFESNKVMEGLRNFEQAVSNEKIRNAVIEVRKHVQEVPLWDLNIEYMADLMGESGTAIKELVIQPLVEAKRTANQWKYDSVDEYARIVENSGIDLSGWSSLEHSGLILGSLKDSEVKRVSYQLEDGSSLDLTYDEAANLMRVIRDEDGFRALVESGIKRKQGRTQVSHSQLTAQDLTNIMQTTPVEIQEYAFGVGDQYFNQYEADKLNALGQETIGQDIAVNGNTYTHLNKDIDDVYNSTNEYSTVSEILNRNAHSSRTPGSLRARSEGANGAIVIEGMTEAVLRSAHEHGIYAGYGKTFGEVEAATTDIARELNKVGGEAVADKLSKKVAMEMSSTSTSKFNTFEKFLKKFRGAYTVGKLGLRLGSAVVQNTSSLLYTVNVEDAATRAKLFGQLPSVMAQSTKQLVSNRFNVEKAYSEMIENDPNMRERLEKGFAIDITENSSAADVKRFIAGMSGAHRDMVSRLVRTVSPETAMGMIRMFDAKAMYEGWLLAKKQVEMETNLTEENGEAYWDQVRERHGTFTRKTQPTSDSMDRTAMQDAPMIKSLAMFASFRSKLWQTIRQGTNDLQSGNIRKGAETLATVVMLQAVSDLMKQTWKAIQGDDVPEEPEEIVAMEVSNLIKSNIFFGDVVADMIVPAMNKTLGTEVNTYGSRSFISDVKDNLISLAAHSQELAQHNSRTNREKVRKDLVKLSAVLKFPVEGFLEYIDAINNIKEELE